MRSRKTEYTHGDVVDWLEGPVLRRRGFLPVKVAQRFDACSCNPVIRLLIVYGYLGLQVS